MGSKVQNSTFSKHGHVAYQIKENHECSNMVPNILLADTLTMGMGQIGQNLPFSEHGHIKYQFKVVRDPCQKITLLLLKSKSVRVIVPESCF